MRIIRRTFRFAALALAITCLATAQGRQSPANNETVWASITIQPSVLWMGANQPILHAYFTIVNDGTATIDPKVGSSHLLINGVEPEDWKDVVNTGNRTSEFDSLPPGRPLQFAFDLGSYFTAAGLYTVGWLGENFKAADVTIRVLPIEQESITPKGKPSVWAAVSVQPSVSWRNQSDQLLVCFSVVNDGPTAINPRSSHLLINGEEPRDWRTTVGGGLRISTIDEVKTFSRNELLPGRVEQFCYGLGEYFKKPGIYTVGWWGENFRAADITIRVLPVERFSFDGRPVR
jgi:hypothetical protein